MSPGESGKYQSIPEAISKAPSGATILVRSGTYSDYVSVDKPLLIIGDGKRQDVVINNDVDLHSASLNTTLQNLTVTGKVDIFGYATIQNCVVRAPIPMRVEDEITSNGQLLYKQTKAIIRQSSIEIPGKPLREYRTGARLRSRVTIRPISKSTRLRFQERRKRKYIHLIPMSS